MKIKQHMRWAGRMLACAAALMCGAGAAADGPAPAAAGAAAVFPLGGDAPAEVRDQVGFSLRQKLKRDGTYPPVDGPTMADVAAASATTLNAATNAAAVRQLSAELSPAVIVWGEVDASDAGPRLILNLLPVQPGEQAAPRRFERVLAKPTDLRFAVEDALKLLPGVGPFERVSEQAFSDDPASAARFAQNPNLLPSGDFSDPAAWHVLLGTADTPPAVSDTLPDADAAAIVPAPAGSGIAAGGHVLAMSLSKNVAEGSGLACLSSPAAVVAGMRYRLAFRFYSDGPTQHVFVKGYAGSGAQELEVYRRQVPPSGATDGKWTTVLCDLTPASLGPAVRQVRVDLYAYASAGLVMFADVELKAVGEPAATAPAPDR